jgi:predicted DNA-binding transcriptional regulator AlpA
MSRLQILYGFDLKQSQWRRIEMPEITLTEGGELKFERRLFTIAETATMLGLSVGTVRNGVAPNSKKPFPIPVIRVGGAIRFDIKDIENFLRLQKAYSNVNPPADQGGNNGGNGSMSDMPGKAIGK